MSMGVSQPWNGVPGEAAPLVDITGARVRRAWAAISMDYQSQRAVSCPLWVAGGRVGEPADGEGVAGGHELVAGLVGGNTVGDRVAGGLGDTVGGGTSVGAQGR